ncbi:RNA polymerase Rpb4-domain-containing protein [Coprinopsis sp. MPI-PUGE-AT-0042]|nr:RNA polymerase Rpb4-domain-containing protein [Coprinopsis sp. MPI-PUGE-AT-0042]
MEVVNARAALLSNYEVLSLLKELEADHLARSKTLQRIKKEDEAVGKTSIPGNTGSVLETSENLRTIEVEAIQYLTFDYLPIKNGTPESITKLVKALEPYDLTKAEKLQIVNLVPTTAVELYVIVEELEDRFGDRMDDLLQAIQDASGSLSVSANPIVNGTGGHPDPSLVDTAWNEKPADAFANDAEAVYDEEMFDDTGEGAGIEGDLDQEED